MQFSALFSYMLWHIELKFCIWLCFTLLQIKCEYHQFASIFVGVMPLLKLRILKIHSFHTFLLHALIYWAEILHMTLFYLTTDQVWVLSICVNFCRSYAPFGTYNTGNTQFSAFFSYILWHIELKLYTADQVRVSSICINFCRSYAPFGTKITGNTQFTALFSNLLWHIELKFFIWLC